MVHKVFFADLTHMGTGINSNTFPLGVGLVASYAQKELKNKIDIEGFEKVAMSTSISETAVKGGDLGWLDENIISEKFISKIVNTPVGDLSEPIFLQEGVLIFKVRDKRKIEKSKNLEEVKNELLNSEKAKILNLYSLTHYDNLRRSVSVSFINE